MVDPYQRFGGTYCFHLDGGRDFLKPEDEGTSSSETLVPVRETTQWQVATKDFTFNIHRRNNFSGYFR
jgi:hypothetical protein